MSDKRLVWLQEDDEENINSNGIDFKKAKEVVLNETSVQIHNIHGDYAFIGLTDDMSLVLFVYCLKEDEFRRITYARKATRNEANAFFHLLAKGKNNGKPKA